LTGFTVNGFRPLPAFDFPFKLNTPARRWRLRKSIGYNGLVVK
jgi:hypothetical protein